MRYTSGLGRRMVVNSYTSTFPPARMQAVRVGVEVDIEIVGVGVRVWVGASGVQVDKNRVGAASGVGVFAESVAPWIAADVGERSAVGTAAGRQAWMRT